MNDWLLTNPFRNVGSFTIGTSVKSELIRVLPLSNYASPDMLLKLFDKLSQGDCRWNNIQLVSKEPCDYYVVFNKTDYPIDKKRTIVFQMEPYMETKAEWGIWGKPDPREFLSVYSHSAHRNNVEWHVGLSYTELMIGGFKKIIPDTLSTVLSEKYFDPGHILRHDFIRRVDGGKDGIKVDIYGECKSKGYKNYKGALPYQRKEKALLPYKYTFNAENHDIPNYFTEKITDAIVSECLCFYWGCSTLEKWIPPESFIRLNLKDIPGSVRIVKEAMENHEWEKRLPKILEAKRILLSQLSFFPTVERIISGCDG